MVSVSIEATERMAPALSGRAIGPGADTCTSQLLSAQAVRSAALGSVGRSQQAATSDRWETAGNADGPDASSDQEVSRMAISRRAFLQAAGWGATAVAVAACSPAGTPGPVSSTTSAAPTTTTRPPAVP